MRDFYHRILNSTAELCSAAEQWDALWERCNYALPIARAELITQWVEFFAPRQPLRVITVYEQKRLVAVLPLVGRGPRGARIGCLPGNEWSSGGALMLDPEVDPAQVCDKIVAGMRCLEWPLLLLDAALPAADPWCHFIAALQRAGMPFRSRSRFRIGQVKIDDDWQSYFGRRSKNHRRQIHRATSRAEAAGGTRLRIFAQLASEDVKGWLRRAFEIEDRGWKGAQGSSVLKTPGMFHFYLLQAQKLAESGQLRLVFLEHRCELIAFEYGWAAKGCYFSAKVGYDASFAHLSPGQLLRAMLFEQFFGDRDCQLVDFCGPTSRAIDDWKTSDYSVDRLMVATRPVGRLMMGAYEVAAPLARGIRRMRCRRPHEQRTIPVNFEEAAKMETPERLGI